MMSTIRFESYWRKLDGSTATWYRTIIADIRGQHAKPCAAAAHALVFGAAATAMSATVILVPSSCRSSVCGPFDAFWGLNGGLQT